MKLKLLVIAFSDSIHTARWIAQLDRLKFDVHLFPSVLSQSLHPGLRNVTVHLAAPAVANQYKETSVQHEYASVLLQNVPAVAGSRLLKKLQIKYAGLVQKKMLRKVISKLQPDIVHTMETQHAGHLYKEAAGNGVIPWVHSTWGIDLHFFKNIIAHRHRLKEMFLSVSVLIAEGERDIAYAHELGYKGKTVVIPSVGGGFDWDEFHDLPFQLHPSGRKEIIIKGYEGDERLASNALLALRSIKSLLYPFEIIVYSCSDKLLPLIDRLRNEDKLTVIAVKDTSRHTILEMTAAARISITNNLSDGVPNTMLEAMALGAFPIQSDTAITDGWIQDGVNGLITQPESVESIAAAISTAISNDELVDTASIYNRQLVREKLDLVIIKNKIEDIYFAAADKTGKRHS